MSLLLITVGTGAVQLNGGYVENRSFDSPVVSTITFDKDGFITDLTDGDPKWYATPTTNVGADYEIFVTRTAGPLPTGTMDTWTSLATDQSWSVTQTTVDEKDTTIQVQIRNLAGNVMASNSYQLIAEVQSDV